jgi:hypothetical protein
MVIKFTSHQFGPFSVLMVGVYNLPMKIFVGILALGVAGLSYGAEPVMDNERVTAWDTSDVLPPAQHDFIAVSLAKLGTAHFGLKGEKPGKAGERMVIVEIKDRVEPHIANTSGLPLAFPRPHVKKLIDNKKVVVWDYTWHPGEPSPMHWHDKDTVVVYEATGALQSTTPDGKVTVNDNKFGDVRFNRRDRSHTELLVSGEGHAVITELK